MKALLTCGGTGGHIYPAIAIADKIKEKHPDAEILFIGTKKGMENTLVPASGYEIKGIDASGIDRHNLLNNIHTIHDVIMGAREAHDIIKEFKPDVAIGTGGYVTGTVIMQAHKEGIPCFIHEQNAVPGVTNKMLEHYAQKLFISFEESRSHFRHPDKTILTGNPIRSAFKVLDRDACRAELGIKENEKLVLAFGGSLGAQVLNEAVLRLIDEMPVSDIKLQFVTGKRYYDDICSSFQQISGKESVVKLINYANNMPTLMCAADLVISRAGAIAVSEITACAKPSVLIPSPNVTNNHQYHNAKAIADAGAALLIEEKDILGDYGIFAKQVLDLINNGEKLTDMSNNAAKIAKLNAADLIYENLNLSNV